VTLTARHCRTLLVGVAVLLATEYGMDVVWKFRYHGWGDFRAYYSAAWALRQGEDLYDGAALNRVWAEVGDPKLKPDTHGYVYPPLFALLLQPATLLSVHTAARVWLVFNAVFWLLGVLLLTRVLEWSPSDLPFWLLLFVALRFEPALWTLSAGQLNIVVFCLVVAGLYGLKRECPKCAGFHLALAGALKLTPFVLVAYLLLRRRYRPVLWTLAFSGLFLAIGIAVVGIEPHLAFVTRILPFLGEGSASPYNQSLAGWALRLSHAVGWGSGRGTATVLVRAIGLVLFALTIYRIRRRELPASAPFDLADVSLCILAVSIASPITWSHHLTWTLLPLAVIFHRLGSRPSSTWQWAAAMGAYAVVGVLDDYYVHPVFSRGPQVLVSSIKLYGLLAMYALVYLIREPVVPLGASDDGVRPEAEEASEMSPEARL
jgi:alpha-1,2-mannosyltransferase